MKSKKKKLFPPNSYEDQKKVFTRNVTLISPNSSGDLHSDAHQNEIVGGDAGEDHTQSIGGDKAYLLGGIIPPSPCRDR